MEQAATACIVFSIIVFLINCIVEMIKQVTGMKGSKAINLCALLTGVVISLLSYLTYISYTNTPVKWYCLIGAILGGMVASLVAMLGWDKVIGIWQRSKVDADTVKLVYPKGSGKDEH